MHTLKACLNPINIHVSEIFNTHRTDYFLTTQQTTGFPIPPFCVLYVITLDTEEFLDLCKCKSQWYNSEQHLYLFTHG